ncbi:DUF2142 domain-containing protein [Microbacterium sp. LWH3-1.2]|uniref:DUF2142 domain-containing protein n=1 Tax=Microbacterium sp. LWH3-1.2 TaxID=3135256 RepID=UPI003431EC2D
MAGMRASSLVSWLQRAIVRWAAMVFLALVLLGGAWAVASPIGAGPDESGHIMKAAATFRGDFTGTPTSAPGIRSFVLPDDVGGLGGEVTCFAGLPNQTAACAPALGSRSHVLIEVESGVAAYNPAYYALVGWPSLFLDGGTMVVAMRLLNVVLVAALWTVVIVTLSFRRPRTAFFACLAITPLTLYLTGVVNPSGAEVAATAAVLVLVDAVATGRGCGTPWLPVVLGVSVGLLINLRSISPLFALLAVLAVLAMRGGAALWDGMRRRSMIVMGLVLIPFALFAVAWTLLVSQSAGFIPSSDRRRPGRLEAFFHTIEQFPSQFTEMVGVMGWFDAWPPTAVHMVWGVLVGGAVLLGALVGRPRHALTVLAAGALLLIAPALIQAASAAQYGYIWQGRYGLPFLAITMTVAALTVEAARPPVAAAGRFTAFAGVLLALQIWSFVAVLKRYAVGADADWGLWATSSAWQPPGGAVLVCVVFASGAALLMGALVVDARRSSARTRAGTTN